jgi:hypothetical protein
MRAPYEALLARYRADYLQAQINGNIRSGSGDYSIKSDVLSRYRFKIRELPSTPLQFAT